MLLFFTDFPMSLEFRIKENIEESGDRLLHRCRNCEHRLQRRLSRRRCQARLGEDAPYHLRPNTQRILSTC